MFIPHIWNKGAEPWEGKPAASGLALEIGTALAMVSGKLAKATGTKKPEFICMQKVDATTDGQLIHVERVREETVYETELSVASASIARGNKYTIDTTGGMITATTDSGVAEVVDFDGTTVGSKVRVRFP
jgi:hypothetical protein